MKLIFSYLQPALFITSLKSLSNSTNPYVFPAFIWNTDKLLDHETNLESVVLPTPDFPTSKQCPKGYLKTRSILRI